MKAKYKHRKMLSSSRRPTEAKHTMEGTKSNQKGETKMKVSYWTSREESGKEVKVVFPLVANTPKHQEVIQERIGRLLSEKYPEKVWERPVWETNGYVSFSMMGARVI